MKTRYMFGDGLKIAEKDREYIEERLEKVEKLLGRYDGQKELLAEVDVKQDKKGFWQLEIMIQTPHQLYRVSKSDHVLSQAMDEIEQGMKKQIRREMERRKDLIKRGGRSIKKKVAIDELARF